MTWRKSLIGPSSSVRDAITVINEGEFRIALVVDDQGKLLGTVTDGDTRRALLRGIGLDSAVKEAMHLNPTVARVGESREAILATMRSKALNQVPIVDAEGRVTHLEILNNLVKESRKENWAVLMAGGLGRRLAPLTDIMPKPMLEVGNKPLLETIIENLVNNGLTRIYIAVNYKADVVKERFGDGAPWKVEIRYIHEDQQLGTAGALSLLVDKPQHPLIVMNADLLTNLNFRHLLDYHDQQGCRATVCVREHAVQIPYGVVAVDENRVVKIEEKPIHRHYINAGIYVLDPDLLAMIPSGTHFDMTALLERMNAEHQPIAVFPIREFWLDIGRHEDYAAANGHYERLFK